MSLSEFFYMGGYAAYVWSAYGIWLVVMVFNAVLPVIKLRQTQARLARRRNGDRGGS
jgi:heme exporter protein D